MRNIKNISFSFIWVSVLAFFMHCFMPHHHHDIDECGVYDINGISEIVDNDHHHHDYSEYDHHHDDDCDHEEDSHHHSLLNCHIHTDLTSFQGFDFNFILPEGLKLIVYKVENEVIYYQNEDDYYFSPEDHKFRRGPPVYFMG